jgi:hypothetical protein
MPDLLCLGEPMLEFNRQPAGPDGRALYLEGHGGDTSNAATAAARSGASVGYVTAIGQDAPGDSFMALWAREGVDTTTVLRTPDAPTGIYVVTHDAQGHHFTFYRARVLIFVHLVFVLILILSLDLVGPAAAHAPCVGSQKLPPYHMYCRSVLSSCRREAAQCGAVRGGAKRSDSETKGF